MTPILGLVAKGLLGAAVIPVTIYAGYLIVGRGPEQTSDLDNKAKELEEEVNKILKDCKPKNEKSGPNMTSGHISTQLKTPQGGTRQTTITGGSEHTVECFSTR